MVYCSAITAHPNSIDAIEYCIVDRSSGDRNEVRILVDWRQHHGDDENLVAAGQPYDATPRS